MWYTGPAKGISSTNLSHPYSVLALICRCIGVCFGTFLLPLVPNKTLQTHAKLMYLTPQLPETTNSSLILHTSIEHLPQPKFKHQHNFLHLRTDLFFPDLPPNSETFMVKQCGQSNYCPKTPLSSNLVIT